MFGPDATAWIGKDPEFYYTSEWVAEAGLTEYRDPGFSLVQSAYVTGRARTRQGALKAAIDHLRRCRSWLARK